MEKKIYEAEFIIGEKERELQKLKEDSMNEQEVMTSKVKELEEKVKWFREN